jgi:glucose-1-phosphate adenylyltransferase
MPITPPIHGKPVSYSGSANALFHNLYLLERSNERNVMIVSGEQVYRMDYAAALSFHTQRGADITVVCIDPRLAAGTNFKRTIVLGEDDRAVRVEENGGGPAPASEARLGPMGIYIFNRDLLVELLNRRGDTGTQTERIDALAADAVSANRRVLVYQFGGVYGRVTPDQYWRTLPTLDSYYEANMDLLRLEPLLDLYQTDWPIRSHQMQCPPARTVPGRSANEGICVNSIVAGGTIVAGGGVNQSVLSNRVYIDDGATVEESILFPGVRIGEGARLHRVICDRDVQVPPRAVIGFDRDADRKRFTVTDNGIVVVPAAYEFGKS